MKNQTTFALAVALLGAAACISGDDEDKPDVSDVKGGPDGKAEAWGSSDDPALFHRTLEYRLSELPRQGAATSAPWTGSYWPVAHDSINYRWDGSGSESPAAKYGRAFGVSGVEAAVSRYHGIESQWSRRACTSDDACSAERGEICARRSGESSGRCIPTWFGICHAWAPAAILVPEPRRPVTYNGVTFKVQDLKALVTLAHDRTETRFVSLRCDALDADQQIYFDRYGRPTGASQSCKDTNPGTYHVLLANYLGRQGEAFVEDRTWDGEVWNQPLRRYKVTSLDEVGPREANQLVGVPAEGGATVERAGDVASAAWSQVGSFAVTPGSALTVAMSGAGDPDLYVRFAAAPTTTAYDCRPYSSTADEICNLTVPDGATRAYVAVASYRSAASYRLRITTGGQIPGRYVFNDRAARLYKVHTDVDYISEAAAETDGNLGGSIDSYTRTDRYDYILEVDSAGKVIGGEWIGTSKRNHPDFVWLPVRAGASSVAGGKITYANVKMLLDQSLGEAPTTGGDRTVHDGGTLAKGSWKQLGPFQVAAGATLRATVTGSGDVDLYVRRGAAPTAASYDCRPYLASSGEQCTVAGPGPVYVAVNGYAASSDFDIAVAYREGTGSSEPAPPPTTVHHLDTTGSVGRGEARDFPLDVVAGRRVVIRSFSSADVDLYIQMGRAPTTDAYLARAFTSSGNEALAYTPSSSGTLHIVVHGYQAGSFTLRTADQ